MGTQSTWGHLEPSCLTMKSIVFFAVIAAAFAEPEPEPKADPKADPYLLYGGYYPYAYGHVGYYGYPYAYYGKRSADPVEEPASGPNADPKADPYFVQWILWTSLFLWILWISILWLLWQEIC